MSLLYLFGLIWKYDSLGFRIAGSDQPNLSVDCLQWHTDEIDADIVVDVKGK